MKNLIYFIILMFVLTITNSSFSQVSFKMKRPPLNQLSASDLWNATIVNSGEAFTAYLTGSMANNSNGEIIAIGKTVSFEVKKGTTNFKVTELPSIPEISYLTRDTKYKESFMNIGGAPPGDYKICLELHNTDNNILGSDCIEQKIIGNESPQLLTPRNEEELNTGNPIFTWIHPIVSGSKQTYTLKIFEQSGNESPEQVVSGNKSFFEKDGLKQQSFQYPSSAPRFEEGKTYYWKISVVQNDVLVAGSEIYSFSTASSESGKNNQPVSDGCMVRNPSFESYTGTVTGGENPIIQNVMGWKSMYKNPDLLSKYNFMRSGATPLYDGNMFAGISSGFSSSLGFATEGLAADLINPVVQGASYDFHARFLLANKRITTGVKIQAYVRSSSVNFIYNDLSTYGQFINEIIVNDKENWQLLFTKFTAAANYNQLLIIGADETPHRNLGYVYLDSVDMCQSTPKQISECNFFDDYESNAGWYEVKKGSIAGTAGDIVNCVQRNSTPSAGSWIKVQGGRCDFKNSEEGGNDYRSYKNIGTFLENSYCWEAKFEFSYSALGVGGRVGHPIFALTSGVWNPINFSDENPMSQNTFCNFSDQDAIMVWFWYPTDKYYDVNGLQRPPVEGRQVAIFPWCKNGKELDLYTPKTQPIIISSNTPYFIKLERINATKGRITVYSDNNYSQEVQPPQCFDIPNGAEIKGLNTLQHSNAPDGMGRELTGYVDNTCITKKEEGSLSCDEVPPSDCIGSECSLVTANVSVCENTPINLKAYSGKLISEINPPKFLNSTDFFDWPSEPDNFSPISTTAGKKYLIKAFGGYPTHWSMAFDPAYQYDKNGTWPNIVCQGLSQFMLTGNNFSITTRPTYPQSYNSQYHEYCYEFTGGGDPISYANPNNISGGSGNIQSFYRFYELCGEASQYNFEWKLISGNANGATFTTGSDSSQFKSSTAGTYKFEISLSCKANNNLIDRDTMEVKVFSSLECLGTPVCGCGNWESMEICDVDGNVIGTAGHRETYIIGNSFPSSIIIRPKYNNFEYPNCSSRMILYVQNDNGQYTFISDGSANYPYLTNNSLNQIPLAGQSSYYLIRINPVIDPGMPGTITCPERNFILRKTQ